MAGKRTNRQCPGKGASLYCAPEATRCRIQAVILRRILCCIYLIPYLLYTIYILYTLKYHTRANSSTGGGVLGRNSSSGGGGGGGVGSKSAGIFIYMCTDKQKKTSGGGVPPPGSATGT